MAKTSENTKGLVISKPERHYLPLEQRILLYEKVLKLSRRRLSPSRIKDMIHGRYGVRLDRHCIIDWINGIHHPLGHVNSFDNRSTPELAYVIGAILSDGNRYLGKNCNYTFRLYTKDYEYATFFGFQLAKVVGRKEPYKPHWSHDYGYWVTRGYSIQLFWALDKPWQELRSYIEHHKDCVAAFLRGFFDGEGNVNGRKTTVSNTKKGLLRYIRHLLRRYFDIKATGPHKGRKEGYYFKSPRNGKFYRAKKRCHYLYIRVRSLQRFSHYIGFTIKRKQRSLLRAIQ